ncbi:MAG: phospho-N-acetylmuramoyl-pentapeptide-transferase [Clostridia bacterium]|nr:phospho-N-acetylmuramoyl-pentapeptide-transferase [Clostridia bacterium]
MDLSLILCTAALIVSFVLTVAAARYVIPKLKSKKMGQPILEIGPRWHKSKEGTPTMGGITFIFAMLVTTALVLLAAVVIDGNIDALMPFLPTLGLGLANGLIGMIDDHAKLLKKQNQGLKAYQKFLLQVIVAAIYLIAMHVITGPETALVIPYFDVELELGAFYYIIALLLITGMVNGVNITDGIDGLAASVTMVIGVFLGVVACIWHDGALGLSGALIIGGTLGFLVYNFYPARVFMGDTGSLFLGGLVVGSAFMLGSPLLVVVMGIVYIIETASVMLQVGSFKLTHGKRIFKMAPIHHHFEMCGWSEIKIVAVASVVTAAACVLAYLGL